ncbi:hypothetical protein D3C86_1203170 [compost metagenome]
MRFDVTHRGAGSGGDAFQRADLIDDIGNQLFRGRVQITAAEADAVRIGDMGADNHAFFGSGLDGAVDAGRITCVKSAGDVGAGDDGEHRLVVTHAPCAVTFAKIAVEIDSGHVCLP